MNLKDIIVPNEINVHKQIWAKDSNQVMYDGLERKSEGHNNADLCPICIQELMNSDITLVAVI